MLPFVEDELGMLSAEYGINFGGWAIPYYFCFGVFNGCKFT